MSLDTGWVASEESVNPGADGSRLVDVPCSWMFPWMNSWLYTHTKCNRASMSRATGDGRELPDGSLLKGAVGVVLGVLALLLECECVCLGRIPGSPDLILPCVCMSQTPLLLAAGCSSRSRGIRFPGGRDRNSGYPLVDRPILTTTLLLLVPVPPPSSHSSSDIRPNKCQQYTVS